MNKALLIEEISNRVGLSKQQVEEMLAAFVDITIETLQDRQELTIAGFGTFSAKFRSARMGVHPQHPNERIRIPAVIVPKFKAGKNLKEALKTIPAEE